MSSKANIEKFIGEVNRFSTSKFILYESKLSRFLSSLSNNQTIYDIIEKCLKGFDFDSEFRRVFGNTQTKVSLPNKPDKLVALVFCILVEIDGKKIDFYKFLKTYFVANEINLAFAQFIEEIIFPFRAAVMALYGDGEEEDELEEVQLEEVEEKQVDNTPIGFFAVDMHTKLRNFATTLNRCEMAMPLFDAMKWAIDTNNKELFQSLAYSLIFVTANRQFSKIAKQLYNANYNPRFRQ